MTTMNNEDPADPSVHEPRIAGVELPEPVMHRVRGFIRGVPQPWRPYGPICPSRYLAEGADVETQALYTADQMREVIAAERGRGAKPPKWWTCPTHGDARSNAWGCPECVRELRGEKAVLEGWITSALGVLRTLESEDSEDGGEELRKLLDAGKRLVCKHPASQ